MANEAEMWADILRDMARQDDAECRVEDHDAFCAAGFIEAQSAQMAELQAENLRIQNEWDNADEMLQACRAQIADLKRALDTARNDAMGKGWRKEIEAVLFWLEGALQCEKFPWDADQWEAAQHDFETLTDLLVASPASEIRGDDTRDAARYRWLRNQRWYESTVAVVSDPKKNVKLGSYCPSDKQLDEVIDAALSLSASPLSQGGQE